MKDVISTRLNKAENADADLLTSIETDALHEAKRWEPRSDYGCCVIDGWGAPCRLGRAPLF